MVETIKTDVLVVGGGAAAARAALEATRQGVKVILVDKEEPGYSGCSPLCLKGLVAGPIGMEDHPLLFYQDWLKNGCGMNDQNLVREAALNAPVNLVQLMELGIDFNRDSEGKYIRYKGAGHAMARNFTIRLGPDDNLIHFFTRAMQNRNVRIEKNLMITRLLKADGAVNGAVGISSKGDLTVFSSKAVVLACGGANRIYACIDNRIRDEKYRTTGDGFALAFHAGAPIIDLEFSNFREVPPGASRNGGRYINAKGERFMERYDPVGLEKAPRQLTVAAFYTELREGRWPVYWEIDEEELKKDIVLYPRFKGLKKVEMGIDFQRLLGGVRINEKAETDVPHLFAAGESAGGLHGGDRMQASAFLETQIFGARAGYHAALRSREIKGTEVDGRQVEKEMSRIRAIQGVIEPREVLEVIQKTMWEQGGIIRDAEGLSKGLKVIEQLKKEKNPKISPKSPFFCLEILNLLLTAEMIMKAALMREESRGSHRRSDFPDQNDAKWHKHIAILNEDGAMVVSSLPVQEIPQASPSS